MSERMMPLRIAVPLLIASPVVMDQWVTDGLVREAAIEFLQDGMNDSNELALPEYQEVHITNHNASWQANPNGEAIIDNLKLPQHQKDYVKFAFNAVKYALENGAQTNPAMMLSIPIIETGYGTDGLSERANNHFGIKGSTEECGSVDSETFEEINGQQIDIVDSFKCYDSPFGSFVDFDSMMKRLPHFADVIPCSGDLTTASNALQHEVDPMTCEIIAYQQETSPVTGNRVLGHATGSAYVALVEDVAHLIHAEELFTPA